MMQVKFHYAQHDLIVLGKLATIFRESMLRRRILPTNPWKAKKVDAWLAKMGARMRPGGRHYDTFRGQVDCANFVNFKVECIQPKCRISGGMYKLGEPYFMRIEIPWELADKVLTLGFIS